MVRMSEWRAILSIGIPIIIGQLGTIVLGFSDTLMIGHHSSTELAAASFVNNMFVLALITSIGFSYGMTPVVGRLFGAGNKKQIGTILKAGLTANALVAVLIMTAMTVLYLFIDRLGQPDELLPLMRPYFLVNLASLPFVVLFNTVKQFFDGITNTRVPMWVMIGGNIMNIVGNYILIYGALGLPELGLFGAGISTALSRMMMGVVLLTIFLTKKKYAVFRRGLKMKGSLRHDFIMLNKMGWPVALQMGMETASFSLSAVMVGWIGTMALTTHQIMLTISQLFYMTYYGLAAAVSVRVSLFHGQNNMQAVKRTAYSGFHIAMTLAVVGVIPLLIFRHDIGYIFTSDPAVCALVAQVIIPMIVYQFGDGLQYTFANSLRGLSRVKPMMYIAFVAYFIVSLPLGYLFGIVLGYGLPGIWFAFPFGLTTAGILYYIWFLKTVKRISLVKN